MPPGFSNRGVAALGAGAGGAAADGVVTGAGAEAPQEIVVARRSA